MNAILKTRRAAAPLVWNCNRINCFLQTFWYDVTGLDYDPVGGNWGAVGTYQSPGSSDTVTSAYAANPAGAWTCIPMATSNVNSPQYHLTYGNGDWVSTGGQISNYSLSSTSSDITTGWTAVTTPCSGLVTFEEPIYGGGYWVQTGLSGCVSTATNPFGPWTLNAGAPIIGYRCGVYGGGLWVLGGTKGTPYSNALWIAVSNNPTGAWTEYNIPLQGDLLGIAYGNGLWAITNAFEVGTANPKIAVTNNPAAAWNIYDFPTGHNMYRIRYGNGLWVAGGGIPGVSCLIYSALNPAGPWVLNDTSCVIWTDPIRSLKYGNGTWVAGKSGGEILTV